MSVTNTLMKSVHATPPRLASFFIVLSNRCACVLADKQRTKEAQKKRIQEIQSRQQKGRIEEEEFCGGKRKS